MNNELTTVGITLCTPKQEARFGEYHFDMGKWTIEIENGKCSIKKLQELFNNNPNICKTIDADPESIYAIFSNMSFREGECVIIKLDKNSSEVIGSMMFILDDIIKNDDSTKEVSIIAYDVLRYFNRYLLFISYNYVYEWEEEEKKFIEGFPKATPRDIETSFYPSYYTSYYIQPQISS